MQEIATLLVFEGKNQRKQIERMMVHEKSLTWNHTIKPEPKNHLDPSTFMTLGSQLIFFLGKMKPLPPEIQHESNSGSFEGALSIYFLGSTVTKNRFTYISQQPLQDVQLLKPKWKRRIDCLALLKTERCFQKRAEERSCWEKLLVFCSLFLSRPPNL